MKIKLFLKDPDGVYDSINEFMKDHPELDQDEVESKISKFVKWGEYVTVEIDLDNLTAEVSEA